ncbi:carboxymuconolactone decarboxylase family protein, partial [Xanthomonas citri pv. citri]|nr:carboxymuconolactone decarboxylase family protein [Xanthomonas citri pv. citri]
RDRSMITVSALITDCFSAYKSGSF